jgi:DNA-directed RNA polymerase subunit RPC12/RpoP
VIRFKCIYCGQRIFTREDGRGKEGKCPKCKHLLVVPETTKGRPAISINKEPIPERPKPRLGPDEQEDVLIAFYKESFGFLVPTYDKLSLFLMVVTLILVYLTNKKMIIEEVIGLVRRPSDGPVDVIRPLYLSYVLLCLFIIFISRERTDFKKGLMVLFVVTVNAFTGIMAGIYMMKGTAGWLLVFPVWNIINGVLLLLMLRFNVIDEECISDREATLVQIILGLIAVLVIFILCNYVFKLYWAITFSICIVYTTSFDRALQNVFPGLTHRGYEQAEQPR